MKLSQTQRKILLDMRNHLSGCSARELGATQRTMRILRAWGCVEVERTEPAVRTIDAVIWRLTEKGRQVPD